MGDYDKIFLDEMTIVFTFKDNPFLPLLNHDLTILEVTVVILFCESIYLFRLTGLY